MSKIIAHFSRKVPAGEYASQQASASIEVELEGENPEATKAALRRLYAIAREAVDEQLAQSSQPARTQQATNRVGQASTNGNGNGGSPRVPATAAQKKAIFAISKAQGLDPAQFNVDSLSIKEASSVIDGLKAQQAGNR